MEKNRNIGLDIVRSVAITLVLICHSGFFLVDTDTTVITFLGVLSVEIFFVLSGFLIGRIMINSIVEESSLLSLKKFYISRWLRTLPVYYMMLIITALVKKQQIPISCFFFVQNFNEVNLNFLPVSWSLSIEEWFYLLVPFILFIMVKFRSTKRTKKNIFFSVSFVLCIIPFGLRIFSVFNNELPWDFAVRKQIFLRLDAIMMGVLLAGIKFYISDIYNRISKSIICLVCSVVGFIVLGIIYYNYLGRADNFNSSELWKIVWFSVLPFLSCLLVMYMENSKYINEVLRGKTITKYIYNLSVLSYALYLIHWNIFEQVSAYCKGWLALVGCTIVSVVISKIVYELFEKPVLKLRKKIIQNI